MASPAGLSLPGLQLKERAALFGALLEVEDWVDSVLDVTVGDQAAVLITDPHAVRSLLRSGAPKGRPRSTLVGVPGYVSTDVAERNVARASVKNALGTASLSAFSISDDPDIAVALMAHLSGAVPSPILRVIARNSRAAMRAAVDRKPGAPVQAVTDALPLRELLTSSGFVSALRERGWDDGAIAEEIIMLTFAGWASIAAVLESACTVGVGGRSVTASDVDELLRLAPPGWLITRELTAPTVLSGRTLSPGTIVITSPWLLHRQTAWWRDPGRYDSGRLGLRRSAAYLPFGLGKWACPAELYSRAILLELLRRRDEGTAAATTRPTLIDGRSACLMRMGTVTG